MKKLKRNKQKKNVGFIANNRVVLAALAGALAGLAVTYLLESEKGRNVLSQVGSSIKNYAGGLKLPTLLHSRVSEQLAGANE